MIYALLMLLFTKRSIFPILRLPVLFNGGNFLITAHVRAAQRLPKGLIFFLLLLPISLCPCFAGVTPLPSFAGFSRGLQRQQQDYNSQNCQYFFHLLLLVYTVYVFGHIIKHKKSGFVSVFFRRSTLKES